MSISKEYSLPVPATHPADQPAIDPDGLTPRVSVRARNWSPGYNRTGMLLPCALSRLTDYQLSLVPPGPIRCFYRTIALHFEQTRVINVVTAQSAASRRNI